MNQIIHFTLFHNNLSSFVIFRDINSDHFSRIFTKVCFFDRNRPTNSSDFEIKSRSTASARLSAYAFTLNTGILFENGDSILTQNGIAIPVH